MWLKFILSIERALRAQQQEFTRVDKNNNNKMYLDTFWCLDADAALIRK